MPEYIPEKEEKFLTEQEVRAIVSSSMENVGMFGGGAGNETFQFDRRKGIWLGAKNFDDAPFKVDMKGAITATGLTITASQVSDLGDLAILDQVDTAQIVNNAISTVKLELLSVTDAVLASNAVTASKIVAGAVTATKISVGTLSAISANIGTVTAGTINGLTITGGTVQTSTSGQRVKMASDVISFYDANGINVNVYGSDEDYMGASFKIDGNFVCDFIATGYFATAIVSDISSLSIGTSAKKWNNLYLGGSITVGGTVDGVDISSHAGNWNAHHSYTSNGYAITPSTVVANGNVTPSTGNSRYCGTASNYWARVYSDAYFTKNTAWQTGWDKYDDLQIIRDLKTIKDKGKSSGYKLDASGLPKEIYDKGFTDFGGLISFNLCASKKIVECIDDLKKTIETLTNRILILETN